MDSEGLSVTLAISHLRFPLAHFRFVSHLPSRTTISRHSMGRFVDFRPRRRRLSLFQFRSTTFLKRCSSGSFSTRWLGTLSYIVHARTSGNQRASTGQLWRWCAATGIASVTTRHSSGQRLNGALPLNTLASPSHAPKLHYWTFTYIFMARSTLLGAGLLVLLSMNRSRLPHC